MVGEICRLIFKVAYEIHQLTWHRVCNWLPDSVILLCDSPCNRLRLVPAPGRNLQVKSQEQDW